MLLAVPPSAMFPKEEQFEEDLADRFAVTMGTFWFVSFFMGLDVYAVGFWALVDNPCMGNLLSKFLD